MKARHRKVAHPLTGEPTEATEIPITKSNELWNEYELEDGTIIRLKSVVTEIFRLDGQVGPDGQPIFAITAQPFMHVVPDEKQG